MSDTNTIIGTVNAPKPELSAETILGALKYRYACKKFDPSKRISDADFETILEAARLAPTSFGMEPWKILVIENKELRRAMAAHVWGGKAGLEGASHFVVLLARKGEEMHFGSPYVDHMLKDIHKLPKEIYDMYGNRYKDFGENHMKLFETPRAGFDWTAKQAYIVLANMLVTAAALGIDSCPIEGFNPAAATRLLGEERKLFDTRSFGIAVMAAFGYRDEKPHRDKTRRPLAESVEWIR